MKSEGKRVIHFSGLNGLRAIAALSVLFSHTTDGLARFNLDSYFMGTFPNGAPRTTMLTGYGVTIFFALSGFLITYLLLEEIRLRGDVNIKNFYIRRILRIWPLYYLYFVLSIATAMIYGLEIDMRSVPFYIFLMANIPFVFGIALPFVGPYWSLGVEEQFYSFWPWIVKKSKSIFKVTLLICIALIILKWILSHFDIRLHEGSANWPYELMYNTRFQCMLIGAMGAILFFRENAIFLKVVDNYLAQALAWGVIVMVAFNEYFVTPFLDHEFIALVTVFLIMGQIKKKHRLINLDLPVFNFIGKISYGIYVIHPLVIFYLSKVIIFNDDKSSNYIVVYLSTLVCTILVAHLTYTYFEKRFLTLKGKFTTVPSSATSR